MKLAARMSRLGTESAFEVLARARALEAKGIDVVHLEIGEPDFDTPQNICDAATTAINKGCTHYTTSQGIPELRAEIAKELGSSRGVSFDPDRIVVTTGAKPIMFYSILALLGEGDEAIHQDPLFPIYESMIKFSGATAVPIPLREELGFRKDMDELRSKVTSRTRMIMINSPQNPSGGVMEEEDIRVLAEIARENDIIVLSDEVYDHIMYDGENYSIASQPGMLDRTILLNGFSKTYAMTGWRMGYGFFPPDLVTQIVRLVTNSVSCAPPFIQQACVEALRGPQDSVPKMVAEFKKRRDLIVDGLNEIPGISCHRPKGAFYVFPNIKKLGMSANKFSDHLLNEGGVATLSGTAFGANGEGYLRLSYATSQENIKKALEKIKMVVAKL